MPNYYGCPCEGCGQPMALKDDIVVCPDCGAPYHRACYEKLGRCVHAHVHGTDYEWKFPYKDEELRICPACGQRTLRDKTRCRCCGAELPPEGVGGRLSHGADADAGQKKNFDYDSLYREFQTSPEDAMRRVRQAAFGKEETMDGISCQDWADYIGPSAKSYMNAYSQMQLRHSKISISFSALLFGPFYFFYRKAWKPAFGFLAAELVLTIPTIISMMEISGSTLTPAISSSALLTLAHICSLLSFALMIVRGMYGKWFYRQSAAARIRRIQAEFPDANQRRAVLNAQGGVSFAAVFGAFLLLMVIGSASTLLLGPDKEALLHAMYGL